MDNNDTEKIKAAWKWFEFHADQRLRAFYYFLLIMGALSWGYINCLLNYSQKLEVVTHVIPFFGIIVSLAFLFIEIRNVELVNIGREVLAALDFPPSVIDSKDPPDRYEIIKTKVLNDAVGNQNKTWHWIVPIVRPVVRHELWLRFIYLTSLIFSIVLFLSSTNACIPLIFVEIIVFLVFIVCLRSFGRSNH